MNKFYQYVLDWLGGQDVTEIRDAAEQGRDLVDDLLPYLPLVRIFLSRADIDQIRAMGHSDWQKIIDIALARMPSIGMVLWNHQQWWCRQLDRARQAIVE